MECLEIHSHLVTLSSTLVFSQITYDWAQREVSGFHERVEAGEESEAEESAPMSGRKPPATAATTAPTTLVMEVEEVGGDLSSRMLDDLSARLQQERAGTVEEAHACTSGNDVESDYTVCFGVFLRDLRMQRVYLDGYARLHKGHVYLGLVLFPVLFLLYELKIAISTMELNKWCRLSGLTETIWFCYTGVEADSMEEYFRVDYPDEWEFCYSVLCGFLVLGGVTNWLLHSRFCKKVSEKSWAMLAVFLCPYVGFSIYAMWEYIFFSEANMNLMTW